MIMQIAAIELHYLARDGTATGNGALQFIETLCSESCAFAGRWGIRGGHVAGTEKLGTQVRRALCRLQGPRHTMVTRYWLLRLHTAVLGALVAFSGATTAQASVLAEKLASANHVLLMRHAYAPGVGDPPGHSLEKCETQRLLDDEGKQQATRTGDWLRSQGVTSAKVYSSAWCRCQQTAERLNFGSVTVSPALASFFDNPEQTLAQNAALQQLIRKALSAKDSQHHQAIILVTHQVNIQAFAGENTRSGEMVLARVTKQGKLLRYQRVAQP